jgi:hypothetical protein
MSRKVKIKTETGTDPFTQIRELSGVVYVALLSKHDKRIVLLGDAHTPYKGLSCKKCHTDCYTVTRFIKSLASYHAKTNTELDVFIETYAPLGNSKQKKDLQQMIDIVKFEETEKEQRREPKILFEIRKEFSKEVYIHTANTIRYHYVDIRVTPFIEETGLGLRSTLSNCSFLKKAAYPTKSKINSTILHICFVNQDPENKISKQFYKLSRTNKQCVRRFIEQRIQAIHKDLPYTEMFDSCFFWLCCLLLDCYMICRFLRFFERQPPGSTTVYFAGAAHTWTLFEFITQMDNNTNCILNTHPTHFKNIVLDEKISTSSKCIRIRDE